MSSAKILDNCKYAMKYLVRAVQLKFESVIPFRNVYKVSTFMTKVKKKALLMHATNENVPIHAEICLKADLHYTTFA
jgi:hypothetical protein